MKAFGNQINPDLVFLFSHPDADEWKHQKFLASEHKSILRPFLSKHFEQCYVTSLKKTVEYRDCFSPQFGIRAPALHEIESCVPQFEKEIGSFTSKPTIIAFGQSTFSALGFLEKVSDVHGREFSWRGHKVIPNFDPFFVSKRPRLVPDFNRNLGSSKSEVETPQYKILNFREAIFQLKRVYDLFLKKKISYLVFDTETTAFDPWLGNLIMCSWAHTEDSCGYAFPLKVNEKISITPEKAIKFFNKTETFDALVKEKMDEYGTSKDFLKSFSRDELSKLSPEKKSEIKIKKKAATAVLQNVTKDVFSELETSLQLGFSVSENEATQFLLLLGKVLSEVPIVGHNLKFDSKWLHEHDVISLDDIKIKDDTLLMAYIIFNKQFGTNLKLQTLVERYFKYTWKDLTKNYLSNFTKISDRHFGNIPTKLLGEYAAKDAYWNLKLYERMKQDLPPEAETILGILSESSKVFSKIESGGLAVDWHTHDFLKQKYEETSEKCLSDMKKMSVVQAFCEEFEDFNPNSSDQLRVLLFESRFYGLPKIPIKKFYTSKDKKQLSTDKNVIKFYLQLFSEMESGEFNQILEKSNPPKEYRHVQKHVQKEEKRNNDDIMYLRWEECYEFLKLYKVFKRIAGKLLPTYINPVRELSPNSLYRPNYSLIATNTGRVSSGFHTMDQGSEITRMFTSRWDGGLIAAFDYSQIEVRIVASLANEPALIEAYRAGYDIHSTTASRVNNIPMEEVTHEQRQRAKVLNFFTIYGGGAETLSDQLKISLKDAELMLDNFFKGYPNLKKWSDDQKALLKKTGEVQTVWGRKIPIPEIHSDNHLLEAHALRAATNYPVQSSASDCVLFSLTRIFNEFKKQNLKSVLIGSVHDSIEVDIYPDELFEVVNIFKKVCEVDVERENTWIKCPLQISFELGSSWGGAIEFDIEEMSQSSLKIVGSGLARDFDALKNTANKKYFVKTHVIESKSLSDSDFGSEHFFRDTEQIKAQIFLGRRQNGDSK